MLLIAGFPVAAYGEYIDDRGIQTVDPAETSRTAQSDCHWQCHCEYIALTGSEYVVSLSLVSMLSVGHLWALSCQRCASSAELRSFGCLHRVNPLTHFTIVKFLLSIHQSSNFQNVTLLHHRMDSYWTTRVLVMGKVNVVMSQFHLSLLWYHLCNCQKYAKPYSCKFQRMLSVCFCVLQFSESYFSFTTGCIPLTLYHKSP